MWCKEKSDVINLIGSDVNFSLHYRPTTREGIDINNTKKKGRVPGGIGWVINHKVIIFGDFNCDLNSYNQNDKIME
ncbi:unnamed protein product [Brachionus calyciflorus]|uniref:Uncharacterized protein n=1 Tax=Brachionus calyciflorus TaxID=104777 RepID=A0A814TAW6_9BILA|nr:unnamed protein product [Brachionus calyciflorus]